MERDVMEEQKWRYAPRHAETITGQVIRDSINGDRIRWNSDGLPWYCHYCNVTLLGRYLLTRYAFDAEELQRFYDSPHRWTEYWEQLNGMS